MKNILIATDFSQNSIDALAYGMEFAKKEGVKVYLFHFFNLPIANVQSQQIIDYSFYETLKRNELSKLADKYKHLPLSIDLICVTGMSIVDEMNSCIKQNQIDLAVIGLKGSSFIDEIFLGSNALSIISNIKIPIIALPMQIKFKQDLKLAFAFDGVVNSKSTHYKFLSNFAKMHNTKINVFHVATKEKDLELYQTLKMEIPQELFTVETKLKDNVDEGVLEYVTNNHIDLLAMIHRKHGFFQRVFHESHTLELAKLANFPLLILPV